jgi:tetratricopeptide (TPR) repeat protein
MSYALRAATLSFICLTSFVVGCNTQATPTTPQVENSTQPAADQTAATNGPAAALSAAESDKLYTDAIQQIKAGQVQTGFNMINELLTKNPYYAKGYDTRAFLLSQANQPVSAIRDMSNLLRLDNKNKDAWNMRGYLLLSLNRHSEAIKDFDKAIEIDPKMVKAYNNRGLAKIAMKDYGNSLNDFNMAIQCQADYVDAYNNRGYALLEIGNYAKAIQSFTEALQIDPKYFNAYNNRGLVRIKTGELELAIKDFNEAIALAPYVEKHYLHRRDTFRTLGREDLALNDEAMIRNIRDLDQAAERVKASPKSPEAVLARADLFLKVNDFKRSERDYSMTLKLNPNSTEACVGLAKVAFNQQEYDRAIEMSDKALGIEPSLSAYSVRGDANFAKGQFDQAVRDYQSAQRFDNQVAQALLNRAQWHETAGRANDAKQDREAAELLNSHMKSTASTQNK